MLVVVTTLTIALPLNQILRIDEIDAQSVQVIVLCLVAQVVAQQQRVVINAGYRCDGLYARGVMASNLTRLAAFLGGIGALVVNQSVVAYAAASSAFVIAGTVMMAIDLNRRRPWIAHGIRRFSATLLKPLTAPALSFLAYSLGLGLSLQGMLMVIHFQGTEAAVVAFDTMRKVSRVLIQAAAVISAPVGVELSSALGRKDKTLSKGLHRNLGQTVALVTVVLFLILFFVSEPLIGALSRQKVAFDSHLLLVLLAAAGVQNFWSPGATVLSAVNKNVSMTTMILVTAGAALTATWILIPVWGILSAAYSLLAAQLVVLVWVEKRACRLLEIDFGSWAKSFARFDVLNQMLLQLRK
jgi:O-antigen/teichoic acid export membrane protein